MKTRLACLAILVLGCGAKEPAKSAANAAEPVPKAEAPVESAPAAPSKKEATVASESSAPAAPAYQADMRDVLQAVIDDDALTPYLHLEQPGRFPLRVGGSVLPKDLQLIKATKPVVFVDDPKREPKKPELVFTEIEI